MSATTNETDDRAERYTWNGENFDEFEVTEGDGEVLSLEEEPAKEASDEMPDIERRINLPHGLTVYIENEEGSLRKGPWGMMIMKNPYGYVAGTEGVDGDAVDCFLGADYATAPTVYVIHQGKPDPEDKLMIGFASARAAAIAYEDNYNKDVSSTFTMDKITLRDLPAKLATLKGRRLQ